MGTIKVDFGKQMRPPQINPKILAIILAVVVGLGVISQAVVIDAEDIPIPKRRVAADQLKPEHERLDKALAAGCLDIEKLRDVS